MQNPFFVIALIQAVLILQVFAARRFGGPTQLIVTTQAAFWSLSFVARPLYFLITRPSARLELADLRLIAAGYQDSLAMILPIVLLGQVAFLSGILLARLRSPKGFASVDRTPREVHTALVVGSALWGLGWLGRLSAYTGLGEFGSLLRPAGVAGGVLLLVVLPNTRRGDRRALLVLAAELVWAFSWESKAAMVVPVLALCFRWIVQQRTKLLARSLLVLVPIVLVGFFLIQNLRGINTASEVAATSSANPLNLRPWIVGLLERFDGLSAVTDAFFLGAGQWLSGGEYAARFVYNLVPKFGLGVQDSTLGQAWTREVRSYSVANQFQNVPLAAGGTAEGYAIWGLAGVIGVNLILAFVVVALGKALGSRRLPVLALAISMVFSTALYEQGTLGLVGALNKAVQIGFAAYIVALFARAFFDQRTGSQMRPSGLATKSTTTALKVGT